MRRRARIDLGQQTGSQKEEQILARKRQRWAARNRDRPEDENPFLRAIKPDQSHYGSADETKEELTRRLNNLEFGNFPGYFNYRNKAAAEAWTESIKHHRPPPSPRSIANRRKAANNAAAAAAAAAAKESQLSNSSQVSQAGDSSAQAARPAAVSCCSPDLSVSPDPLGGGDDGDESAHQADSLSIEQPLEAGLSDERLAFLKREWFEGKTVLDIGCNRGHITYAIGRLFAPKLILGIDIDLKMIKMANRDLHLHLAGLVSEAQEFRLSRAARLRLEGGSTGYREHRNQFPFSNYVSHGPLALALGSGCLEDGARELRGSREDIQQSRDLTTPCYAINLPSFGDIVQDNDDEDDDGFEQENGRSYDDSDLDLDDELELSAKYRFPNNILFVEHNYVLANDELVEKQEAQFDTIVCLSVTKWIHLNYCDDGLKRFFKRAYKHLKPGGLFILEAQPFDNYGRRKRLSDRLRANYYSIKFKPDQFDAYLLGEQVGFRQIIQASVTEHQCAGFKRPLKVFLK